MNTLKYGMVACGAPNSLKRQLTEIEDCVSYIKREKLDSVERQKVLNEILNHIDKLDLMLVVIKNNIY